MLTSVALITTVIFGTLLFKNHQNNLAADSAFQADKTRFAQVEKDMQTAYDAIVTAVGKPDKEESGKSCSYTSRKFEQGDLRCAITYRFQYLLNNTFDRETGSTRILSTLSNTKFPKSNSMSNFTVQATPDESTDIRLDYDNKMVCNININYQIEEDEYTFRCRSVVTQKLYPLAE